MGWQDRPYYRDSSSSGTNRLMWLLTGSIPLFTVFEIRVRAHASLIICALLVLIFGLGDGYVWEDRIESMVVLFLVVLLHEFGHCFAARWVGGDANEIEMSPLGGRALAQPPHRWLPTLITVAAGPGVNVIICLITGILLWAVRHSVLFNPLDLVPVSPIFSWFDPIRYAAFFYSISYMLLIFNILPVYPLDGGQIVQSLLWWKWGHYRATIIACSVGIVGSVLMIAVAIAIGIPAPMRGLFLGLIGVSCLLTCIMQRRETMAAGPEEYADETDYSAAYEPATPRRKKSRSNQRLIKQARKRAADARLEQERIDQILAKVSAHGMASLTWSERRALRKATEHRRKRDLELSQ